MIKFVTEDGTKYMITFQHNNYAAKKHNKEIPQGTACKLYKLTENKPDKQLIRDCMVTLYHKDNFCRATGRKEVFRKLLTVINIPGFRL